MSDPRPEAQSATPLASRIGRRPLLAGILGLGAAGLATTAYGFSRLTGNGKTTASATSTPSAIAASPSASPEYAVAVASPATPVTPQVARMPSAQAEGSPTAAATAFKIGPDQALVTSLRLPLFGVSGDEAVRLLAGSVSDWREVGSPISMKVMPLAIQNQVPAGAQPAKVVQDYKALVDAISKDLGGVAVVPLDQVDFRVNVLSIDDVDPLRQAADTIRMAVVGDIVPGRNVDDKMRYYGDYTHPFLEVADELKSYDVTFANLEGDLSDNIQPPADAHTFSFVSSTKMLDGFKLAGIDAVTLANNHSTWNGQGWGVQGLLDTLDALDAAGLGRFGAGHNLDEARAPWIADVKGKKVALLGIDGVTANEEQRANGATVNESWLGAASYAGAGPDQPGTNPYITDQFLGDITAAAKQYDIVIPYIHMGVEYVAVLPDWAVEGARAAIDAGATMVVTNHPHVIQGMEIYKGKPIVYSPGNFIFDQMFSVEVRTGLILEMVFRNNKVVGLRPKGVEIVDFNQPRLMAAAEHAALMDRFWWATDRLAAR
jgi:poly-gamma-glutamate synthesis protein (capsule biosynthesis protein)